MHKRTAHRAQPTSAPSSQRKLGSSHPRRRVWIPASARMTRGVAVLLTVLVAGCTADPPAAPDMRKQALPNVNLDRQWKAIGNAAPDAVQDEWLKSFNAPELDALVREALEHNPDLRIAAARVEQAAQY